MFAAFFKQYLLSPICYVAVILAALFLLNQFTYFNVSLGSNNNKNSFEVIGSGKVNNTPSKAGTSFTVTQKGATQQEAKDSANKIQNQAIAELTTLGIDKKNITTTSFSVNPNYEQGGSGIQTQIYPQRQVQNGYVATITTQVKNSSVSQINKAIDRLSALGANVGGVEYGTTDQTVYTNEAQIKAIQNAKEQAQSLAQAAGFKLGKIIGIRNADINNAIQPYAAGLALQAAPSSGNTNLQPGTNETVAHMGVTFLIGN